MVGHFVSWLLGPSWEACWKCWSGCLWEAAQVFAQRLAWYLVFVCSGLSQQVATCIATFLLALQPPSLRYLSGPFCLTFCAFGADLACFVLKRPFVVVFSLKFPVLLWGPFPAVLVTFCLRAFLAVACYFCSVSSRTQQEFCKGK